MDDIIVVSSRVEDANNPPIRDAIIRKCKECGHAVWLAPSSPQDKDMMCLQCAVDLIPGTDAKIADPTPEQLAEVRANLESTKWTKANDTEGIDANADPEAFWKWLKTPPKPGEENLQFHLGGNTPGRADYVILETAHETFAYTPAQIRDIADEMAEMTTKGPTPPQVYDLIVKLRYMANECEAQQEADQVEKKN